MMNKVPLKYKLNACDFERFKALAPIGDALALIWTTFTAKTDCPCCLGTRLLVVTTAAFALGWLL